MDYTDYLKFLFALILVLSLMGGLALFMKKIGFGQGGGIGQKNRRLKIIETLPIGAKHKAVLLQRDDDTQHLILLGTNSDTVVETNIKAPKIETNVKHNTTH